MSTTSIRKNQKFNFLISMIGKVNICFQSHVWLGSIITETHKSVQHVNRTPTVQIKLQSVRDVHRGLRLTYRTLNVVKFYSY